MLEDKKKIIKLMLSKELRDKLGITQDQLKKLLREYYQKNINTKWNDEIFATFDGSL